MERTSTMTARRTRSIAGHPGLAGKIAQEPARPTALGQETGFIRYLGTVDPKPVQAARRRGEARRAAGQVEDALFWTTAHRGGIEEQEIGGESWRDTAAITDAKNRRRPAGKLPD